MGRWEFLAFAFASAAAHAADSPCLELHAQAAEISARTPSACAEARETRERFVSAFPTLFALCQNLEQEPVPAPGATTQAVAELRARHLAARQAHAAQVEDLLRTPIDHADLNAPALGEDCVDAIETYARFRRNVLRIVSDFHQKIDALDEEAFKNAQEVPKT